MEHLWAMADVWTEDRLSELGVDDLNLTDEQAYRFMEYVARIQGYKGAVGADISDLPKEAHAFLEKWQAMAIEIKESLDNLNEVLGMNIATVEDFFPLRHQEGAQETSEEEGSVEAEIYRVGAHRTGSFSTVVHNPVVQARQYLTDVSKIIMFGNELISLREKVKTELPNIAKLDPIDDSVPPKPESEKSPAEKVRDEARDFDRIAKEKFNIDPTPELEPEFLENVRMYEKDGGGRQVKDLGQAKLGDFKMKDIPFIGELFEKVGRDWANIVDPMYIVQYMDDNSEVDADGRLYGANANIWARLIVAPTANHKREKEAHQKKTVELMKDFHGEYEALNKILHRVLVADKDAMRIAYDSRMSDAEKASLLGITEKQVGAVNHFANELRTFNQEVAEGMDVRSDLQKISADRRRRFGKLDKKANEGTITDEELAEYKAFAPEFSEHVESSILRKVARVMFEKQAIDAVDFFALFDSRMNSAISSKHYKDSVKQIQAWADHLRSQGQEDNAKWWETKIESNIKGNLFSFENEILDFIALGAQKAAGKKGDAKGKDPKPSSIRESIQYSDIPRMKVRLIEGMQRLQAARVNAFLVGNIGWTMTTQPMSLTLAIRMVGVKEVSASMARFWSKEIDVSDSDVVEIKSGGGLSHLEATGSSFTSDSTRKTKRQVLRDHLSIPAAAMEGYVTSIAYDAGFHYAKNTLGMNDHDAKMHGDFVAAASQSMYDKVTRNSALNSNLLRAWAPMQSYVFSAMSGALDMMNVVGVDRSKAQRVREAVRLMIAQRLWQLILSMMFGDSFPKAIFDPVFSKGTIGSNVPVIGKDIDIMTTKLLPWQKSKEWMGDSAMDRWTSKTLRIAKSAAKGDDHWERELAIYMGQYITPALGIGGTVPASNLFRTMSALKVGEIQGISGRKYKELSQAPAPLKVVGGTIFGTKGIDAPETLRNPRE